MLWYLGPTAAPPPAGQTVVGSKQESACVETPIQPSLAALDKVAAIVVGKKPGCCNVPRHTLRVRMWF